jgi:hypothetical protein
MATSPVSPSGRPAPNGKTRWPWSDNGANDLGHRRIANGAEKLYIVTEKGQDAGFPDKEGMGFVSNKRFGWEAYRGNAKAITGLTNCRSQPFKKRWRARNDVALWRTHLSKPSWSRRSSRSTWRDIQQLDGLNLQGTRKAIYLNGEIDGVRRGGGDTVLHGDLAGGGPRCVASRAGRLV